MTAEDDVLYEQHLDRIQAKMPDRAGAVLARLRRREMMPLRVTAACLLMVGGLVGFLPVVGFWMLPLGLLLLAQDVPFLRRVSVRMFMVFEQWGRKVKEALERSWITRRWRQFRQS